MWHPPPPASAAVVPSEASWEDLFDSGQLDSQLQSLNIKQQAPPPPPHAAFHMPPPQQSYPLFNHPPPPLPASVGGGGGIVILQRPQNSYAYARPSFRLQQPPVAVIPQFSIPPPQIAPQIQVMSSTEHGRLTEYRPPEPQMKILKRPQSSPGNLSAQGGNGGSKGQRQRPKTLKQREEEYAQARLRILGSAGNPEDDEDEAFVQPSENGACPLVMKAPLASAECTIRTPRGPDGTKGFHRENQ